MSSRFRIEPRVAWQIVGEEALLLDLESGRALGLNPTGTLIWKHLESEPADAIADLVAGSFDVTRETAISDTAEFLELLSVRGLIRSEEAAGG